MAEWTIFSTTTVTACAGYKMTSFYGTAFWKKLRAQCLKRDRVCATPGCSRRAVVADHIIPRAKGGTDTLDNLRGLCIVHHNMRRQGGEPFVKGCGADGQPADPTHWWNVSASRDLKLR